MPSSSRAAVVLVNLGTPIAPTPKAVRTYLREFLSDRRVIEMPRVLWRPILELFILPIRPRQSAAKYATIWTDEGSPLLVNTENLVAKLRNRAELAGLSNDTVSYHFAMRYGDPSISDTLDALRADGVERVLVVPLYPQYSATTTATVLDEVHRYSLRTRNQLELRTIRSFPELPGYLDALADRVTTYWQEYERPEFSRGDKLLLSFHGIPQSMADDGDPYPQECQATADGLRLRLGLSAEECPMTFQSKFGPAPWLTPATIDTVGELGRQKTRRVDVICPAFVADCLETLEEINQLNREAFDDAGGEEFHHIPCLNTHDGWVTALSELIQEHLGGWVSPSTESIVNRSS